MKPSKTLNIFLWIAQGILAATFIWTGYMKIFQPQDLPFPWVKDNPGLVLFTGIIDLTGGIGIVLPALFRIKPGLTVFAAYGIIFLMISAIVFHISRGETEDIGFNIFVTAVAIFVALGRKKFN